MFNSGKFYIDNGFRIGISKQGRKWTTVIYLNGCRIKSRRVRNVKLRAPKCICGTRSYSTQEVAKRLLGTTLLGTERQMSETVRRLLNSVIQEAL